MRRWLPVLLFIVAATALGLPLGALIASGLLCDCRHLPPPAGN